VNAALAENGNAPFQSDASHHRHAVANCIGYALIGNAER
jgi:hypothetical protein